MEQALVSVIIPVYNCKQYLAESIESVLSQTYHPVEIIVVNDGSTDESEDIAKKYTSRLRYSYQQHSGQAVARNKGIKLARGNFLAFLDADDLWLKDKLNNQMTTFDANPELDMVFGQIKEFYSPKLDRHQESNVSHVGKIIPGYSVCTLLIKQESFLRVGLFSTTWQVGEFIDWYSKAMEQGLKGFMLPKVIMKRRLHADNIGIRKSNLRTDYVRVLKNSLDRRKKQNLT